MDEYTVQREVFILTYSDYDEVEGTMFFLKIWGFALLLITILYVMNNATNDVDEEDFDSKV